MDLTRLDVHEGWSSRRSPPYVRQVTVSGPCEHLDLVREVTPSANGCEDCLRTGGGWVHLRLCMTCGHVGCCDDSPNRHASAHWHDNPGHPVVRSFEPGEDWWWCYADSLLFDVPGVGPAPSYT